MSQYNFIASKKNLVPFSYGIRYEGSRLIIEDYDFIQISKDELFDDLLPYTDVPNVMCIGYGRKYLERPEKLINYIESALEKQNSLELFSIWLGEDCEVEKKSIWY